MVRDRYGPHSALFVELLTTAVLDAVDHGCADETDLALLLAAHVLRTTNRVTVTRKIPGGTWFIEKYGLYGTAICAKVYPGPIVSSCDIGPRLNIGPGRRTRAHHLSTETTPRASRILWMDSSGTRVHVPVRRIQYTSQTFTRTGPDDIGSATIERLTAGYSKLGTLVGCFPVCDVPETILAYAGTDRIDDDQRSTTPPRENRVPRPFARKMFFVTTRPPEEPPRAIVRIPRPI